MIKKAAFATWDGIHVDLHFGQAEFLEIYDIEAYFKQQTPVDRRRKMVQKDLHQSNHMATLLDTLNDCDALFVTKIGPQMANYLIQNGIRVFETTDVISDIITAIQENNENQTQWGNEQ